MRSLRPLCGERKGVVTKKIVRQQLQRSNQHNKMQVWAIFASVLIGSLFHVGSAELSTGKETWTQSTTGAGWGWSDVAISSTGQNQTAIAIVDTVSKLFQSTNYGKFWTQNWAIPQIDTRSDNAYSAVATSSDGKYVAAVVGTAGAMYLSVDYGTTWKSPTGLPNTANWYDVTMTPDGKFMGAVIMGGYVWYSSDYGANWAKASFYIGSNMYANIQESYFSIDVSDSGKYWAVACGNTLTPPGRVYHGEYEKNPDDTPNSLFFDIAKVSGLEQGANQQWIAVSISSDGSKVTALNSLVAGGVFQSTDQGATFSKTASAPGVTSLDHVAMSANGTVQILSSSTTAGSSMYLTTDGGRTWGATAPAGTWMGVDVDTNGDFIAAVNNGVGEYSYVA